MEAREIKEKAAIIISDMQRTHQELAGGKVRGLKSAFEVVALAVRTVESSADEFKMAGADKKALAVEILNALIDLPYLPEAAEAFILSYAIDMAVAVLNKLLGPSWSEKLAN